MTEEPVFDSPAVIATRAAARERRRAIGWRADFFLDGDARLDEQLRFVVETTFARITSEIETAIRQDAVRLLIERGHRATADKVLGLPRENTSLVARPWAVSNELIEELILRCRHDILTEALPLAVPRPDAPSLLVRLLGSPNRDLADASSALLAAENRRADGVSPSDLPRELHQHLVWLITATLYLAGDPADLLRNHALTKAAESTIAAHDEGARLEAAAVGLATAIDAGPEALPAFLIDALEDRRLSLFCAMIAHAVAIDSREVGALAVDPRDDRLWLALRAAGLGRSDVARIALILADADPRRDLDGFADRLDAIAAITPDEGRAALAPLALPAGFRAALREVERRRR